MALFRYNALIAILRLYRTLIDNTWVAFGNHGNIFRNFG